MNRQAGALPRTARARGARLARRLRAVFVPPADRLLPPAPGLAWGLGLIAAILGLGAMAALGLALPGGRVAAGGAVAATATLSILAGEAEVEAQARAALDVLRATEGVRGVRVIGVEEQRALLAPWLGTEVAVDGLTLPLMIEVTAERGGLDAPALRARLAAEAPAAVFDDHSAWRAPLIGWGARLWRGGLVGLGLAGVALALAAGLAATAGVARAREAVAVLRLAGARDRLVAAVVARRAGRAALVGAAAGAGAGAALMLKAADPDGAMPIELGLTGTEALLAAPVALAAGLLAAAAAGATARRLLSGEG